MKRLTTPQAMKLYKAIMSKCVEGDRGPWTVEMRADIAKEMRRVMGARTDRGAGRVISGWMCWDRDYTATTFARKIRAQARELGHEINGAT